MTDDAFTALFGAVWDTITRTLPDGRIAQVFPITFGRARLGVSRPEWFASGYEDVW
jgi:hypothetical protein